MNSTLDPAAPNAFAAAVQWLEGTLLGSVASIIAAIAVASLGFLLLSGRIDVRRATRVIFGCFILFGASSIAAGIINAVDGTSRTAEAQTPLPLPYPMNPVNVPPAVSAYDPYAGAAMPMRD